MRGCVVWLLIGGGLLIERDDLGLDVVIDQELRLGEDAVSESFWRALMAIGTYSLLMMAAVRPARFGATAFGGEIAGGGACRVVPTPKFVFMWNWPAIHCCSTARRKLEVAETARIFTST
jgi:hypothetical protein